MRVNRDKWNGVHKGGPLAGYQGAQGRSDILRARCARREAGATGTRLESAWASALEISSEPLV